MNASDVYVIDDGSTDETTLLARRLGVQVMRNAKNLGKASSIQKLVGCFELVERYSYVSLIDADTTVHPCNAEQIVALAAGDGRVLQSAQDPAGGTRGYTRRWETRGDGVIRIECWMIDVAQHAWSGGHPSGSYTDPRGPDASAAMVRFFLEGASDAPAPGPQPVHSSSPMP